MADNLLAFIAQHRKAKGWTLRELASKSGVSAAELSRLERGIGSPRIATLGKIAAAFDVALTVRFVQGPPPNKTDLCPMLRIECIRTQCAWWGKCPRGPDKPVLSFDEEHEQKPEAPTGH